MYLVERKNMNIEYQLISFLINLVCWIFIPQEIHLDSTLLQMTILHKSKEFVLHATHMIWYRINLDIISNWKKHICIRCYSNRKLINEALNKVEYEISISSLVSLYECKICKEKNLERRTVTLRRIIDL
jgi:hypothetical protein